VTVSGCLANVLITQLHCAAASGTDNIELGNFVEITIRIDYTNSRSMDVERTERDQDR